VPEYDAFGREIGENPLSGLGGEAGAAPPQPSPEPAPEPSASDGWTETAPPPAAPEPAQVTFSVPEGAPVTVMPTVRRRRTGGLGCLVGLVILAAVVAGPVIVVFSIVGSASDVIDDVSDAIDDGTPILPDVPDVPTPPTGITGRSLIAQDNFAGALRRLKSAGFQKAVMIRLAPERLDAPVVKDGRVRNVQIRFDREFDRGQPSPGATRGIPALSFSAIDPAAPARLVRGSAERYRVKPKGIDYVLASPDAGDGHHWAAYFKNGVQVEGDAKGRVVRRIN
jgi:hypothetical protein